VDKDRTHHFQTRPSWRDGTRLMSCSGCAHRLSSQNLLAYPRLKNGCMFTSSHHLDHSTSPQQRLTLLPPSTGLNLTQRPKLSNDPRVILITHLRRLPTEDPASSKLVISPVAPIQVGLALGLFATRSLVNSFTAIELANLTCEMVQKTSSLVRQKLPLRHHELVGSVKGRSI
jgi:hypothetical protein